MSARINKKLLDVKFIAKKDFEVNSLREIKINDISLKHIDKSNFIIEQNSFKGYYGSLKYALRKFFVLLHGELSIRFETFADEYADVKASLPCKLIDIENIKYELLKGVSDEKA